MKIGIFDPYLDTLGGGEKYVLDIASCLSQNHSVFLFWDDPAILKKAKERFNINLSNVSTTQNIFSSGNSFIRKVKKTKEYDVIFYVSDGSIPTLFSKRNILIFQFPTLWVNGKSLTTKLKLKKIDAVICYSYFVKSFLDKLLGVESIVIPPAVETVLKPFKKENIILTVGRFTKGKNEKKQEILIDAFKKMCDRGLSEWKFVVVGAVLPADEKFVQDLKSRVKGYPIEVSENVSFEKLMIYYGKAKIYWHGAGFGEDLAKHPEYAEHFGISTVEAMGAGAVPVVINAGGQKEIVEEGLSGFLWDTIQELQNKTMKLAQDKNLWEKMSSAAQKRAEFFAGDRFCREINKLINS